MKLKIKTVGVVVKRGRPEPRKLAIKLIDWLTKRKIKVICDDELAKQIKFNKHCAKERLPKSSDLIITIGGDGTLLSVVKNFEDRVVPVMGINMGGMGFLTEVTPEDATETLEQVLSGKVTPQKRMMLKAVIKRDGKVKSKWLVLNDVVINKGALARIIDLRTYVDGKYLTTYKSDGVIIATPTGSTAYSLAAGGPLVSRDVSSIVLTPICPHMLTNRSMVVNHNSVVKIVLEESNGKVYLTLDGQRGHALEEGDVIEVSKAKREMFLFGSRKRDYFAILRGKLRLGER